MKTHAVKLTVSLAPIDPPAGAPTPAPTTVEVKDTLELRRSIAALPFAPPKPPSTFAAPKSVALAAALRGAHMLVATDDQGRTAKIRVEDTDDEGSLFERLGGIMADLGVNEADTLAAPLADATRLNPTQMTVLQDTSARAAFRSKEAMPKLLKRMRKLGFDKAATKRVLDYMRRAPITLNFNPDKSLHVDTSPSGAQTQLAVDRTKFTIDAFLADGFYRNQFETLITNGSHAPFWGGARDGWERTIFMGGYHTHPLVPDERPKYGASNAFGAVAGPAASYGACYFVLKEAVRERTTFTPKNSSRCQAQQVGTSVSFAHVLLELKDKQIERLHEMASGAGKLDPTRSWTYVEAQIHGPIAFAEDIAEIVVNTKFKGTDYEAKLRELAAKAGATIKWHDGKTVTEDVK